MNKKFFVPFETAKALKEKGYPNNTEMLYDNETGELISSAAYANPKYWIGDKYMYLIAAPTYHEVADWLWKKGKFIFAEYRAYENDWAGFIGEINGEMKYLTEFPTREEALNAGILAALEML